MAERLSATCPARPAGCASRHALIRDTLYDGLTRRAGCSSTRSAGEALEAVYAADLEPPPRRAGAPLRRRRARRAARDKAVDYARRAGDRAAAQLAYEEAVRLYEMALALVDDDVVRCELLLASVRPRRGPATRLGSKQAFREAAELAERRGLGEQLARAALGYGGRVMWEVSRDDPHLVPLLERALAAIGEGDSPLRVRLLARLAGGPLRDASFPPERKVALSSEALAMARRIGDPRRLPTRSTATSSATTRPTTLAAGRARHRADRGRDARRRPGTRRRGTRRTSRLPDRTGGHRGGKAELEAMTKVVQELRQPAQAWIASVYRAMLAVLEGRFDEAEGLISHTRDLGERALGWSAAVTHGLQLYVLRRQQGGSPRSRTSFEAQPGSTPPIRSGAACWCTWAELGAPRRPATL